MTKAQIIELIKRVQSGDRSIVTLMALRRATGNPNVLMMLEQLELEDLPPGKIFDLICRNVSDADPLAEGDEKTKPKPMRKLPDIDICRAQSSGYGGYADCLVEEPYSCIHALSFGFKFFCLHPEREKIIARTGGK